MCDGRAEIQQQQNVSQNDEEEHDNDNKDKFKIMNQLKLLHFSFWYHVLLALRSSSTGGILFPLKMTELYGNYPKLIYYIVKNNLDTKYNIEQVKLLTITNNIEDESKTGHLHDITANINRPNNQTKYVNYKIIYKWCYNSCSFTHVMYNVMNIYNMFQSLSY